MCIEWETFWTALSAIATATAVVVALFIVKWQDVISNRKKLKIEWLNCSDTHTTQDKALYASYKGFHEGLTLSGIKVRFVNIGNRKLILQDVAIELANDMKYPLIPEIFEKNPGMNFPCTLEIEETSEFWIPIERFIKDINQKINEKRISPNEKINLVVEDTVGKKYFLTTGHSFGDYCKGDTT